MTTLIELAPGTRFVVVCAAPPWDGLAGTLVHVSDSRARVRWDATADTAARTDSIAANTEVEVTA